MWDIVWRSGRKRMFMSCTFMITDLSGREGKLRKQGVETRESAV